MFNRQISNGFTLVELLVVVAIISLLMALLMPTLKQSILQARTMQCLNQLKYIGFAWNRYLDANKGKTMQYSANLNAPMWANMIFPYMDGIPGYNFIGTMPTRLGPEFICPFNYSKFGTADPSVGGYPINSPNGYRTYEWGVFYGYPFAVWEQVQYNTLRVRNTTRAPLLVGTSSYHCGMSWVWHFGINNVPIRHPQANDLDMLFLDGHVSMEYRDKQSQYWTWVK